MNTADIEQKREAVNHAAAKLQEAEEVDARRGGARVARRPYVDQCKAVHERAQVALRLAEQDAAKAERDRKTWAADRRVAPILARVRPPLAPVYDRMARAIFDAFAVVRDVQSLRDMTQAGCAAAVLDAEALATELDVDLYRNAESVTRHPLKPITADEIQVEIRSRLEALCKNEGVDALSFPGWINVFPSH